jgi:hypothetical protein
MKTFIVLIENDGACFGLLVDIVFGVDDNLLSLLTVQRFLSDFSRSVASSQLSIDLVFLAVQIQLQISGFIFS